jgi:hypothetical protein
MRRSNGIRRVFLCVGFISMPAAFAQSDTAAELPLRTTFVCHLSSGPRAGQTLELAEAQAAAPVRMGSTCSDGASSAGTVISQSPDIRRTASNPEGAVARPVSWICRFSSGPRAGEIRDLTGIPGAVAVPVGGTCTDGADSRGIAVIPDAGPVSTSWSDASPPSAGRAVSTICQFMSGPKAHGWHDYAPLPAATVGSRCQDGASSAGIVVLAGHGEQY